MALSPAQKTTLKAFILATPALNTLYVDGNLDGLAAALNAPAAPTFTVWKTSVSINDVGKGFINTGLAALMSANNDRLISFAAYNSIVDPSRADQRAFFDDVFSAASGASTRASLLALWKRTASVIEKLFATGTGSDASPATLTYEDVLPYSDLIGL
jgi:hypothetical protein